MIYKCVYHFVFLQSLQKLESMLAEANQRERKYKRGSYIDSDLSVDEWKAKKCKTSHDDKSRHYESIYMKSAYYKSKTNRDNNEIKYKKSILNGKESSNRVFLKPSAVVTDYRTEKYISNHIPSSSVSSKGWKKKEFQKETGKYSSECEGIRSGVSDSKEELENDNNSSIQEKPLSDKEMNELAAKITKAEILGNVVSLNSILTLM